MKISTLVKAFLLVALGFLCGMEVGYNGEISLLRWGELPLRRERPPTESEYMRVKAESYPVFNLLAVEMATDHYAEMLQNDMKPEELTQLSYALESRLEELTYQTWFPLHWRARRLLAELLIQQERLKEVRSLLWNYDELPGPENIYEEQDYRDSLIMLGAVHEILGEGDLALRAYEESLRQPPERGTVEFAKSRIELIASVTPYPGTPLDSPELKYVLNPLRSRGILYAVRTTKERPVASPLSSEYWGVPLPEESE